MREENVKAVEALTLKIRAKEEEARQLKVVVNSFYTDEGEHPPYPEANTASVSLGALRSDLFYGKTLAEAAQIYLEMRKTSNQGSASVNEIYSALKAGGYAFDTKNEEYAKNGVRISLRKNSTIFHQLPAGDYGLCSWYGVKGPKEEAKPKRAKKRRVKPSPETNGQPKVETAPSNRKTNPKAQEPEAAGAHK